MPDPAELAVRLHVALEAAGIPHAIGGAIALGFHAEPRATKDVDLNLFVDEKSLDRPIAALKSAGCEIDEAEAEKRAAERGDFVGRIEGYRVDVFVAFHAYHEEVRARVRKARLLGQDVPILSAEDLIVFKVLFDRPKDWVDIAAMAAAVSPDKAYVRRWVREILGETDSRLARVDEALG